DPGGRATRGGERRPPWSSRRKGACVASRIEHAPRTAGCRAPPPLAGPPAPRARSLNRPDPALLSCAAMRQGSLFPDGFEILEEALDALRDVDVARAERLLRRVQAVGPDPINADIVREACAFLRSHVTAHPSVEACAAALRAVVRDVEGERLRSASADFVDEVLAGYLLRAHGAELEPPEADDRVPVGRVLLLAGRTDAAYR